MKYLYNYHEFSLAILQFLLYMRCLLRHLCSFSICQGLYLGDSPVLLLYIYDQILYQVLKYQIFVHYLIVQSKQETYLNGLYLYMRIAFCVDVCVSIHQADSLK